MAVERTTVRQARKERPCTGYCRSTIRPGDLYLEHVVGPGHDILTNERWLRQAECATCAGERGVLVQKPVPAETGP